MEEEIHNRIQHAEERAAQGDLIGAILIYTRAIKAHPTQAALYAGRGRIYMYEHNYQAARKDVETALKLKSMNSESASEAQRTKEAS